MTAFRPTASRLVGADPAADAIGELARNGRLKPVLANAVAENVARLLADSGALPARDAAALPTEELQRLVAVQVHEFLAPILDGAPRAATIPADRSVRAARLRALKADIVASLGRSDLSVRTLAARHRITPRYVQTLFDSEDTTFTEFVRDRRISLAHRMLTDARFADCSITSIAFEVGFGDLSYFNRLFRRRFGCSPSATRRAGGRTPRAGAECCSVTVASPRPSPSHRRGRRCYPHPEEPSSARSASEASRRMRAAQARHNGHVPSA